MLIRTVDAKDRCIHSWIPATRFELVKDDGGTPREILTEQPATFKKSVRIAHVTNMCKSFYLVVSPACGFANNGPVNIVQPDLIQSCRTLRSKSAIVEKMPMNVVGKQKTVLSVLNKSVMKACGTADIIPAG